ncbi:CopG family transcriptional regulator [Shewanella sp. AS16]|uniref:CopG family transcriptional regulator n=1 Tax=Shewanella sp. AS16 TaxID=2907625 RepID=UPI001F39B309|nr:CopG family transcriptional regulator [Shewanella sp. AS16]MCE9686620.1 CopG family transcriptional regulator [Shewanella sp. AS16]
MGLADLKKNYTQSKKVTAQLSLDDFIEAANLYAMGQAPEARQTTAQLVPFIRPAQGAQNKQDNRPHEPFRKATFTLSESAISQLADLASECEIAKSKLVRFLIEHHYALPVHERKQKEQSLYRD